MEAKSGLRQAEQNNLATTKTRRILPPARPFGHSQILIIINTSMGGSPLFLVWRGVGVHGRTQINAVVHTYITFSRWKVLAVLLRLRALASKVVCNCVLTRIMSSIYHARLSINSYLALHAYCFLPLINPRVCFPYLLRKANAKQVNNHAPSLSSLNLAVNCLPTSIQ